MNLHCKYGVVIHEKATFPRGNSDISLSIIEENGKIVVFEDKYLYFNSFQRAEEILWKAVRDEKITQEEFLILINKMWDLGLR